jgi:hypothetical protein
VLKWPAQGHEFKPVSQKEKKKEITICQALV